MRPTIVLVDDDQHVLHVLQRYVSRTFAGGEVELLATTSAHVAQQYCMTQHVTLLVADYRARA